MDLYRALEEMRALSKQNKSFSFSFMSCNMAEAKSDGIIMVHNARLLSREDKHHHVHAEIVERYLNLDTMKVRHFYQPLLMTFNGENITLS